MDIIELARRYHAYERVDGSGDTFQRRARILQSMWRESRGYGIGEHRGRPAGARLVMPSAQTELWNFLTDSIGKAVHDELGSLDGRDELYDTDRFYGHCLSSQPLCFNLFAELRLDLDLATEVMRQLAPALPIGTVTHVWFEYSPGRRDPRYLGDNTAFDVFIGFDASGGGRGLIGIEAKYHEDLKGGRDYHKPRYDEVADEMGCFHPDSLPTLRRPRLQQLWRNHLLAGIMARQDGYGHHLSVTLRPGGNTCCAKAIAEYRACLTDDSTFSEWLLEDVVEVLRRHTDAEWVEQFHDRYLAFEKVDAALATLQVDDQSDGADENPTGCC